MHVCHLLFLYIRYIYPNRTKIYIFINILSRNLHCSDTFMSTLIVTSKSFCFNRCTYTSLSHFTFPNPVPMTCVQTFTFQKLRLESKFNHFRTENIQWYTININIAKSRLRPVDCDSDSLIHGYLASPSNLT